MLDFMIGSRKKVKAKVVCWNKVPCLIVSFKNSNPPEVWQMDLEKLTNYTLKLSEHEGEWDLGYVVPDGAFKAVAHFDERPEAECAYDAIQKVLINSNSTCPTAGGFSFFGRMVRGFLMASGVVAIALLFVSLAVSNISSLFSSPSSADFAQQKQRTLDELPGNAAVLSVQPKMEVGVPMNADDVLPKGVE